MKIKIISILLLSMSTSILFAQDDKAIDSAHTLYTKKEFLAAFNLISHAIAETERPYHNVIYDAACYASKSNLPDTAISYLNRLLIVGEYDMVLTDAANDTNFVNLKTDTRWRMLLQKAGRIKENEHLAEMSSIVTCVKYEDSLFHFTKSNIVSRLEKISTQNLPEAIHHFNQYPFINRRNKKDLLNFAAEINDSIYSFYAVQLPFGYDNNKSYPLLIVLHGAVGSNLGWASPRIQIKYGWNYDTTGINQFFSQFGYATNTIIVYPQANWEYNWMTSDKGFSMIPNIVKDVKHYFNIDDNKVFLSGHSNGATGTISYLLKDPSFFAGFYGFNSNPQIRTGGTFIKNALNRSYFNEATDKDYYFPLSGHDTLAAVAKHLGIDWQNHVYKGFPHWFPQFKESKPAFELMFEDMATRNRNSFKSELFWECDDVNFGRCDWIKIDVLDTLAARKDWQTEINFSTTHWIDNTDTARVSDTVITAFNFQRLSGAVKAKYKNNAFDIETSRVKRITVFLSLEMIDFTKPILIKVNGKVLFDKKMNYDRDFILQTFFENLDRKAVWVNTITLSI